MFTVFSAYIELEFSDKSEAIHAAALNAAAVYDDIRETIIADYRTPETENDYKG